MPSKITFTDTTNSNLPLPKPASKYIPDWYKNIQSYTTGVKIPDGKGETTGTIKKCIPVFDAITAGYIIVSPADIFVSIKEIEGQKKQYFEWSDYSLISFHPIDQAPTHPLQNNFPYPKFINPWSIKTPKGYSTLFVQPFHRPSIFTILPGIVDTDMYTAAVNFPFVINDVSFEGLIPCGTPIAQVIPFKRENWEAVLGNSQNFIEVKGVEQKLRTKIFDKYKSLFWESKQYK